MNAQIREIHSLLGSIRIEQFRSLLPLIFALNDHLHCVLKQPVKFLEKGWIIWRLHSPNRALAEATVQ